MDDLPFANAQGKPTTGVQTEPTVGAQGKSTSVQDKSNQVAPQTGGHPEKVESHLEEVGRRHELSPEVKKAGVEHIGGEIELGLQEKKIGMEEAAEATSVTLGPGAVTLPLTDEQLENKTLGKLPISDSLRWLWEWCLRVKKIIHHKLQSS